MQPAEPPLRVTSTHGADEFEGSVLGIATTSIRWVVLSLAGGALLFTYLMRTMPFLHAAAAAFLPSIVVVVALRWMQHGKPPGHAANVIESMVTGGHASPRSAVGRSLPPLFPSLPDAHLIDGLTIGEGPDGPWIARGWEIQAPDLQTASAAELNAHQDAWSALLRQLSPNDTLQVLCESSAGDAERLLAYRKVTETSTNPVIRDQRNRIFLAHWRRMELGRLRRRQVSVFLIRPLARTAWNPRSGDASIQKPGQLVDVRQAMDQWEHALRRTLEPIGGRVIPLGDADVIRLWADRLNPSSQESVGFDPARHFDPELSMLENEWSSDLRCHGRNGGFTLDRYQHVTISLQRLPSDTSPLLMQGLWYVPHRGILLVAHIRRLDKEPILRRAQASVERIHRQLQGKPDERMAVHQAQLHERIRRLSEGEAVPLGFELTVLLRARTAEEIDTLVAAVKAAAQTMSGARIYEASLPATSRQLFAATFPGSQGSRRAGYLHVAEDRSVADCLPLASSFNGHPGPVESLFHGADGNLVNTVSFLGEGSASTPQNLLILGAPGVGKSIVLEKILHETDPLFGFTAIIDSGFSQASYPRSLGTEPIIFRLDGSQTVNPFDTGRLPWTPFGTATIVATLQRMVGAPKDEDRARRQAALLEREILKLREEKAVDVLRRWSEEQREALFRHCLALVEIAAEQTCSFLDAFTAFDELRRTNPEAAESQLRKFSEEAVREVEGGHRADLHDLVFAYLAPEDHLTLSSFREGLEMSEDEDHRWLAVLLVPWTQGGAYGRLFDGAQTTRMDGRILAFELSQLPHSARQVTEVIGFLLINAVHHRCLHLPRAMRKRVVIEEISQFLEIPGAEGILRTASETYRKYGVQLLMTGQTYSRIADTPVRAAIFGNLRSLMIFNTGDRQDIERLSRDLGLSRLAQEAILRFPRPDQQTGQKFSAFLYYHTDPRQPVCGVARHIITQGGDHLDTNPAPTNPSSV